MDADADDVAGRDGRRVPGIQGFVGDERIAVSLGCRRGQHIEPPRRDHPNAERQRTRVDEVNFIEVRTPVLKYCTLRRL